MDRILLPLLVIAVLLAAGCTEGRTPSGSPAGPGVAAPGTTVQPDGILPSGRSAVLVNGTFSLTASVDHIETGSPGADGRTLDVYIRAKNTGTESLYLTWYSTLTDTRGATYGGIGVSHDGAGAQTTLLLPGYAETARDYIVIPDEAVYSSLKDGATLDVRFFARNARGVPVAAFHSAWNVDAGRI